MNDQFASGWAGGPGVCGGGSRDEYINADANEVIQFLAGMGKVRVNEAGCGDLYWLRNHYAFFEYHVDYRGYELHPREVHPNCVGLDYRPGFDILSRTMRPCHVIISRLVFIHFTNVMIQIAIERFRETGARFLIASHYKVESNDDRHDMASYLATGYDLSKPPFNLGMKAREERNALFLL